MNIYLIMTIGGILGIFAHSLKKVNEINKLHDNMSFQEVFVMYWSHDKLAVFTSVVCYGILLFVSSEFINYGKIDHPDIGDSLQDKLLHFRIANFIKLTSVTVAYFSDSIVYGFMGVTEKRIQKKFADESASLDKPKT
jgi:hypothetical protein